MSSQLLEKVLEDHVSYPLDEIAVHLSDSVEPKQLQGTLDFVRVWEQSFAGFYRSSTQKEALKRWLFDFPIEEIRNFISANILQLVLNVTENCNLRCKYCIFSENYPLTHSYDSHGMSLKTAQHAVDYFFALAEPLTKRIPGKKLAITFYGGEPLIAFDLIREIVPYIKSTAPCEIIFHISTNGTLLDQEKVDFLIENDFNIACSIDGPKQEQDRNRVFSGDQGTFDKVWKNLTELKRRYPDYSQLMFLSVYDYKTDLCGTANFFNDKVSDVALSGFVNAVSEVGTDYYTQFSEEDHLRSKEQQAQLWNDYIRSRVEETSLSPYTRALCEVVLGSLIYRSRSNDQRFPPFPFGANCVPGMKISVRPNGTFDICERVNGTAPIGDLETGLDFHRIQTLINNYNKNITQYCFDCPVTRLCSLCFALTNNNGSFEQQNSYCSKALEIFQERLSTYYSILEENPNAFDYFGDEKKLTNWIVNR